MSLGELERMVMDVLWDAPTKAVSVREVAEHFPDHAYTTILTVLSRLSKKGFVNESKVGRSNRFQAVATRGEYLSSIMNEVLSSSDDRNAVLTSFANSISSRDTALLRRLLDKRSK